MHAFNNNATKYLATDWFGLISQILLKSFRQKVKLKVGKFLVLQG